MAIEFWMILMIIPGQLGPDRGPRGTLLLRE